MRTRTKSCFLAGLLAALFILVGCTGNGQVVEVTEVSVSESGVRFALPLDYIHHTKDVTYDELVDAGMSAADAQNWMDIGYNPYYLDFFDNSNDILIYTAIWGNVDATLTEKFNENAAENAYVGTKVNGGEVLHSGYFETPAAKYLYQEIKTDAGLLLQSYYTERDGGQVSFVGVSWAPINEAKKNSLDHFVEGFTFEKPTEALPTGTLEEKPVGEGFSL